MGEYAIDKETKEEIKIGTCESMYYLRYEDRFKVSHIPGNVDPSKDCDLFWRLPFPDEDNVQIGHYEKHDRGLLLVDFIDPETAEDTGTVQLRHESGLMMNVACYHGNKIPDGTPEIRLGWNGRTPHFYELAFIKNTKDGIIPVVRCRFCGEMWRYTWDEILPYIKDEEMRYRLELLSIS